MIIRSISVTLLPAYAHYKFGQMVKNKLPAKYQRLLEDYQDLYEIGLHGPDILFFYHPIIRHPITQIGVVIHHETGRVFFEHARTQMHRSAAEGDKMQKALWAYALGVVCHFALDASCHTYINHFEKTRRISHHEIEKEFEKYNDAGMLRLISEDIQDFYELTDSEQYSEETGLNLEVDYGMALWS